MATTYNPSERRLRTLKVLLADDEEYDCIHANLLLRRIGVTAHCIKSGREAVRAVLEAHEAGTGFDVCMIDWRMPGMDGLEAVRIIREKLGGDTLFIILMAYDWSGIEEEARRAGVNAFLDKPLLESTLYNILFSVSGMHPPSG